MTESKTGTGESFFEEVRVLKQAVWVLRKERRREGCHSQANG